MVAHHAYCSSRSIMTRFQTHTGSGPGWLWLCVCVGHPGCGCSWLGDVAACAVSADAGRVCIVLQHASHSSDQDNCRHMASPCTAALASLFERCSVHTLYSRALDTISDHSRTGTLWHTRSHRHTSTRTHHAPAGRQRQTYKACSMCSMSTVRQAVPYHFA